MKVAITGHTSGLGLAFFNFFKSKNYQVTGFSKSTGYNIANKDHRNKIIEESKEADIFINNAYNNFDDSQLELLQSVFELWRGTNKLIVNVSSRYTKDDTPYCRTKKDQDTFCQSKEYQLPRILNLKPGLIDTPRVKHISDQKMSTDEVIDLFEKIMYSTVHSVTFGKINK